MHNHDAQKVERKGCLCYAALAPTPAQLQATRGLYEASESISVENGKDNTMLSQTEACYCLNCNSVALLFDFLP